MEQLQAFFVEGHQLIFFCHLSQNFLMTFFCSLEFKKGYYFFEKGHIWPAGHRLVTPAAWCIYASAL